ncbi:rod shape-determining protein MreD [Albidovulum inexpectatum]|uniref:Rod shape-determining protein MreD n=1 Tax=Albidovulum inexpectatum TaxID=196587 RepID=A0A2S5JLJ0_9RHOB|nr:rod shape-determining protein MreD [Albidovulum inexpectatum]PPB82105.1 rod shape-determining protein MreD [Albidovulum inexpectatum]
MVDPRLASRLAHRAAYLVLAAVLIVLRLLPLSTQPSAWPLPDLLLCLTLAWLLRRPDHVPALSIVAVLLIEDLLTLRPVGLWPLIILSVTEILRSRSSGLRDLPFVVEWMVVAGAVFLAGLIDWVVLALALAPQVGLGPTMVQAALTVMAYPAVVAALAVLLGIRRIGDTDAPTRRRLT